ncbi:MAG: amidohydrolase family protein [Gemmatimonadota bacterium]
MTHRTPLRSQGINLALLFLLVFPAVASAQYREPPPPAAYALENVTVFHADGREEVGVNVVVRGGLIVAMGAGVGIPADALVLEGDSLRVYPGLVDAHGSVDLNFPTMEDMGEVLSWDPPREAQGFTPHRLAADYLAGGGADFRAERNSGVIAAGVHPVGGMAPGQGAAVLFRRSAKTPTDLVVQPRLGLLFSFQGGRGGYPSSLFAVIAHFRQMFEDAARYGLIRAEYARDPVGMTLPRWDPDFEVLREAASGNLPVYFHADDDEDIRRVLKLADEIGFRPIIVGGEEAWQVAGELAAENIPVLLSVAFPKPSEWKPSEKEGEGEGMSVPGEELEPAAAREKERLENAYATAARLLDAGVTVALTSGGGGGDLREGARKAMEYGLSEGDALRAVTTTPASILGMPHITTLRPGMAANFIVTDGSLFEEKTGVRYTFVEGEMEKGREARPSGGGEAPSVDVSGPWAVALNAQGMEMAFTMSLSQDGSSFAGSMSGGEIGEAQIEDGTVSGNSLTFTIVFSTGTESMEIETSATVTGDRMSGSGSGAMGSFTFTATRSPGAEGAMR